MDKEKLLDIISSEIHKPVKKKFKRRKIISFGIDKIWSADLVDLSEWKEDNDGYKYILTVIDLFSRYAWAKPLKSKTAKEVKEAFEEITEESESLPDKLYVDQGSEFYNKILNAFLKKNGITIYSTFSEFKASPIERFNKRLKNMMWRLFTRRNTRRWVDRLNRLLTVYNETDQKSLMMNPKEARKKKHEKKIKNSQFIFYGNEKNKPKFNVGDYVRISRIKGIFEKGYLPNWSRQIFKVVEVLNTEPVTYKIADLNGENIKGSFYESELMKSKQGEEGLVEKVLQVKKIKGEKMMLVKWLGLDKSYNSWVPYNEEYL